MILIVVRKVGWQTSPWDSFTRTFDTEAEFLDWWLAQPENSYMKKVANQPEYETVKVYRCESAADLLVPWRPPPHTGETLG